MHSGGDIPPTLKQILRGGQKESRICFRNLSSPCTALLERSTEVLTTRMCPAFITPNLLPFPSSFSATPLAAAAEAARAATTCPHHTCNELQTLYNERASEREREKLSIYLPNALASPYLASRLPFPLLLSNNLKTSISLPAKPAI